MLGDPVLQKHLSPYLPASRELLHDLKAKADRTWRDRTLVDRSKTAAEVVVDGDRGQRRWPSPLIQECTGFIHTLERGEKLTEDEASYRGRWRSEPAR